MNRWTAIEDEKLKETYKKYPKDWRIIAQQVGKTERQCEERMRKINKDIGAPTVREAKMRKQTETWTLAEDILLLQLTEKQGQAQNEIKDRIIQGGLELQKEIRVFKRENQRKLNKLMVKIQKAFKSESDRMIIKDFLKMLLLIQVPRNQVKLLMYGMHGLMSL